MCFFDVSFLHCRIIVERKGANTVQQTHRTLFVCLLFLFWHQVDHQRLAPPKPKKLMLISPPSSPPDGWEQAPENNPAINYELVAALAGMSDDAGEIELQAETAQAPKLVVQSGP